MMKLVARAFGKRKKAAAKGGTAARPSTAEPDAMTPADAVPPKPPAHAPDDLSLEELEDMVIAAPMPAASVPTSAPLSPPTARPASAAPKAMPAAGSATKKQAPRAPANRTAPSPEREALIRDALAIQRAKADVFADLSEEAREKLYVMAMKTMVDKDFGEN